jgi:4-hydroxybenzoate polyprenyltransferase
MILTRLGPLVRLTRFREYVWFVLITTLLGAAVGRGGFGLRLILVTVANWLAVGFAFMINDVEDAPDDALTPAKQIRNPVSAGEITTGRGRALAFLAAVLAAILYSVLGLLPFIAGLACLTLAFLYSWRRIRLKSVPVADLVSHALLLAGLQFLTAYLTYESHHAWQWVYPLMFVMAISLYGQLFNELRDLEGDRRAGVIHTASLLGPRLAHFLMMGWLFLGIVSALAAVLVAHLIPTWVLSVMGALAAVLLYRPLRRPRGSLSGIEGQQSLQKPLETAGALSLAAWFAGPWALSAVERLLPPAAQTLATLLNWWHAIP